MIAIPDDKWGERPLLIVAPKSGEVRVTGAGAWLRCAAGERCVLTGDCAACAATPRRRSLPSTGAGAHAGERAGVAGGAHRPVVDARRRGVCQGESLKQSWGALLCFLPCMHVGGRGCTRARLHTSLPPLTRTPKQPCRRRSRTPPQARSASSRCESSLVGTARAARGCRGPFWAALALALVCLLASTACPAAHCYVLHVGMRRGHARGGKYWGAFRCGGSQAVRQEAGPPKTGWCDAMLQQRQQGTEHPKGLATHTSKGLRDAGCCGGRASAGVYIIRYRVTGVPQRALGPRLTWG